MALPRPVTRTLVTAGVLSGMGAAFLVGTSFGSGGPEGGSDPSGPGSDASPAAYTGSDLSLAGSCDELLEWYVDQAVDQVGPYGWGSDQPVYFGAEENSLELPAAESLAGGIARDSANAAAPAPVRATSEESGTNVQEAGVDEPDVVKTDGTTLYRIEDGDLVTFDLTGDEVERLASVDVPGAGWDTTELLLSGETVVVVSTDEPGTDRATTHVATYDVSDPADPELTHTVEHDADLVTARLHDGVVRLVLSAGLPELEFTQPDDHTTDFEATEHNREVVRASGIEDWLITAAYDDGTAGPLLDCEQVAVPDEESALGTVAVVGFDAPRPDAPSVGGVAVDTDLAYASTDQLYLATGPYVRGPVVNCWNCLEPAPAPDSGPFVGDGTLGEIVPDWVPRPRTDFGNGTTDAASHLYAFDLSGTDTVFAASGEVDGVIRDRWSMDAVDGTLRVAVGPNFSTSDANSVVTFRQEGNDLVEAGRLDDLGVGEDIKSVRWFDTLAIVVTFRQVDPLYAVDLTSADDPELMGELKIPGFSSYLHPLGEQRLLGVGEGPGQGGQWGAQAAVFDVTDLTDPRQLDVESFGPGSTAMATLDPRQLTWLPDGRTVLSVVADYGSRSGGTGYVSVLTLGDGELANRMVEVEYGDEVGQVRLVPLSDGRVVLVTGEDASFFDTTAG